jgi:serine/threonine protein kinase
LAGYRILHEIGAGAMSKVYLGRHKALGYPVAIKVLKSELARNESFISRFRREARAAAALRNSNIVPVIDEQIDGNVHMIVMEYVEGRDLKQLYDELRTEATGLPYYPPELALLLLEEVANGLRAAHARKIIHRDIKPSNIMVSVEGEVKVTDFGLARDNQSADSDITHDGLIMGTAAYMAPEQAQAGDIDHRTDIFPLGVMAFEFLTGQRPFRGSSEFEILERIQHAPPAALVTENCPLVTPRLQRFLGTLLAKNRDDRYQSMDEVITAIGACMEDLDPEGVAYRHRREYFRLFVKDPCALANRLRQERIKHHWQLGQQHRQATPPRLSAALAEFRTVHRLDPKHDGAATAIKEIESEHRPQAVDEIGLGTMPGRPGAEPDAAAPQQPPSRSPEPSPAPPGPPAPPPPPISPRHPPWRRLATGFGVVVVAVIGALFLPHFLRPDRDTPPSRPVPEPLVIEGTMPPAPSDSEQVERDIISRIPVDVPIDSQVDSLVDSPANDGGALTSPKPARPPAPSTVQVILRNSTPLQSCDGGESWPVLVIKDRKEMAATSTDFVVELEPNARYEIAFRCAGHEPSIETWQPWREAGGAPTWYELSTSDHKDQYFRITTAGSQRIGAFMPKR